MPCEPYQDALIEAAASGLEPQGELRVHLAACPACRGTLAQEQSLFSSIDTGLHTAINVEMPASLLPRVRARLRDETPSPMRLIHAWVAVAASLALFTGFLSFRHERQDVRGGLMESNKAVRSLPSGESPASHRAIPPTEQVLYAAPRRHLLNQANLSPEEPRALVPAEQPEVIARLLDGLHRGEMNGEVLLAESNVRQSQDLQIAPLTVAPIDVKPLDGAQPNLD